MEELNQVIVPLTKGIKHVAFSKDGIFIAASDMSDDHSIAVWQIKPGNLLSLIAKGKGCKENIMSLSFNEAGNTVIATCVKSIVFFQCKDGNI